MIPFNTSLYRAKKMLLETRKSEKLLHILVSFDVVLLWHYIIFITPFKWTVNNGKMQW